MICLVSNIALNLFACIFKKNECYLEIAFTFQSTAYECWLKWVKSMCNSNQFHQKIDSFFIIIGKKESTNIPLNKIYYLRKMEIWMTNHHILIKDPTFLRQTLTKKIDVLMYIQIMLNKMDWLLGCQKIVGKCSFLDFHKHLI